MLNVTCNIHSNERIARIILGALLLLGVLIGLGKVIAFLMGVILVIEGIIGWCGIPILAEKLKLNDLFKKKDY